jgi:hypothetical protein
LAVDHIGATAVGPRVAVIGMEVWGERCAAVSAAAAGREQQRRALAPAEPAAGVPVGHLSASQNGMSSSESPPVTGADSKSPVSSGMSPLRLAGSGRLLSS